MVLNNCVKIKLISVIRPVIKVHANNKRISALLDSGAVFPVWFGSEKSLKNSFSNVEDTNFMIYLKGVNNKVYPRMVYKIPRIDLVSDCKNCMNSSLVLYDVYVALVPDIISDESTRSFNLLLSWSLFRFIKENNSRYRLSITFDYNSEESDNGILCIRHNIRVGILIRPDYLYRPNTSIQVKDDKTGRYVLSSVHCNYQELILDDNEINNSANVAGAFRELYRGKRVDNDKES